MNVGQAVSRDTAGSVLAGHASRLSVLEATPVIATYEIKIVADDDTLSTGDSLFVFAIPQDLDGRRLLSAEAFVSTAGSSTTTVQIRNVGVSDMLSVPITIDSGDFTSYSSASRSTVSGADEVSVGNLIAIDVDTAGTGAKGLGVILKYG